MLPVNPRFHTDDKKNKLTRKLNTTRIQQLEKTFALTIPEKINILALFLGHKWITDVAIDQKDKSVAAEVLRQLGLPYEENYYEYNGERHTWLQAAANSAILQYVLEKRESLSVLEAGVLYGYPVSHSLGYIGMLEKEMKGSDKTIAEFYLSGVFSYTYSRCETGYFEKIWKDISAQSPVITHEAEVYYAQYKK
jgi:hypothetical protein